METLKIEIVNPKAVNLINNLVDLNLIRIKKDNSTSEFSKLINNIRGSSNKDITIDEITEEVDFERKKRYEN